MPSVKLSPLFNDGQLDSTTGEPLAGGKVYWYLAGTTTPTTTYTDEAGTIPQANPVILNSRGEPDNPIWLATGQACKAVLKDSLDNTIRTVDNISGVNDVTTPTISEWVLYAPTASYIGSTSFSVPGDATATLTVGRRIKAPVSGYDVYGTISTSTYGAGITTVVLTLDGSGLNSGLVNVYYGFLDPTYPSINTFPAGTKMPFYQASPPSGWTAATVQNDSMMRVVTSGTTGGASGNASPGHSPILNDMIPLHTHGFANSVWVNAAGVMQTSAGSSYSFSTESVSQNNTGAKAGNWQPRYMDFCVGQKS